MACAIVALIAAWVPGLARADGDPASDVLLEQNLFQPWDASTSSAEQARLNALLAEAARSGFPVRVALIDSAADLGTVTALWRRPANYAYYLGTELSLAYHGLVLVVMPDGFGLYPAGQLADREAHVLEALGAPGSGARLAVAAVTAVARMASADGHPLSLASSPSRASGGAPSTGDGGAWIAFCLGVVVIALTWFASFRARPPALWRRRIPT